MSKIEWITIYDENNIARGSISKEWRDKTIETIDLAFDKISEMILNDIINGTIDDE